MPTSALAKKLQLKPGAKVALVNAPAGMAKKLVPLPDGAKVAGPRAHADAVIGFAKDRAELARVAPQAIGRVGADHLVWLCYPKGGAKAKTDLNRDVLWELVADGHGLEGVTLVAIDETWSAMRFRPKGAGKAR